MTPASALWTDATRRALTLSSGSPTLVLLLGRVAPAGSGRHLRYSQWFSQPSFRGSTTKTPRRSWSTRATTCSARACWSSSQSSNAIGLKPFFPEAPVADVVQRRPRPREQKPFDGHRVKGKLHHGPPASRRWSLGPSRSCSRSPGISGRPASWPGRCGRCAREVG